MLTLNLKTKHFEKVDLLKKHSYQRCDLYQLSQSRWCEQNCWTLAQQA